MPTLLRIGSFRFHFYSDEGSEPPHIHVRCNEGEAKFWLIPVSLANNRGVPLHNLREIERLVFEHTNCLSRNIMNTIETKIEPVAIDVWTEKRMIYVELTDGRVVGFPADRFQILSGATDKQLKDVHIEVNGHALRWEELDEDLTVSGRFQLPLMKKAA